MKNYIHQLIEDLKEAAKQTPSIPFFEIPPHLANIPEIAELAMMPYKPISEWTNIETLAFPDIIELDGKQIKTINKAIRKVLENLNLEIIDLPEDLPDELFYEIIKDYWDYPIQYLPSSGFEMEICTGDPQTCPYGDYCDCSEYKEDLKIPENIKDALCEIAQKIVAEKFCSLDIENCEIKEYKKENDYTEALIFSRKWIIYYEPIDAKHELDFIYKFANSQKNNGRLKNEIEMIFEGENPIMHFMHFINKKALNEEWNKFRNTIILYQVRQKLLQYYRDEADGCFEINGFYNDDGTKVNIENVAVPAMCMSCKSFYTESAKENMLCIMNRHDQKNSNDFSCFAFENI